MKNRFLVLFSGGMDSTTALYWALKQGEVAAAMSVNYGQRHNVELEAAALIAEQAGVAHLVLDLSSWGSLLTGSSLTDPAVDVPDGHYEDKTMADTVVPNRNATMLMAAAGVAQALGADHVVTAVHSGDHEIYPDCRPEFITSANLTARLGTGGEVGVVAPFAEIDKADIVYYAQKLGAPLALTWSCYKGGAHHCGQCGTCTERREAFQLAGITDPTTYEEQD